MLCYYGDGSFGMTAFDMETANRFGVPYIAVIGNNSAMNQIRYGQLAKYGEQRGNVGNLLGDVPFGKFAEMLGGYGEEVRDPAQIAPALQRARESVQRLGTLGGDQHLGRPARVRAGHQEPDHVQVRRGRRTVAWARHWTAFAYSTSRTCSRVRPARSCWPGSAPTSSRSSAPGAGDITREQLRDIPDVDSLYFTMLNHNKRSITLDTKHASGKAVLERLIKHCDVLVENFAPGALDRMGFTWERIQQLNPRMIVASVKGFGPGPYEDCKVYENVAQCAGGAASTTGFDDGPPLVTGAQIGDSGTGLHLALGIVCALYQRKTSGRGQRVLAAMQDGVLNLCRVKLRDQQRLARTGVMKEYPQYPDGKFGSAVPRAGNASGGGQPGWIIKCKGWETDPNAYLYFITQAPVWKEICQVIGKQEWITDPDYATPHARLPRLKEIFAAVEALDHDQDQVRGHGRVQPARHSLRPDPVDGGTGRGAVAARHRHDRRGRPSDARQISVGRQPDQDVRQPHRGQALAAARGTHRRGAGRTRPGRR